MSPNSTQHQSIFSYSLSRSFPFRWFTPGTVVGAIVFTALFSFLNFASGGYNLIVQTSSNPNVTVSQGDWLKHWPSFLTTKVQPTCQPANIVVNSQFFTNQTALKYTLTNVWQLDETSGNSVISPSLTYNNNLLEHCSITSIEVDLAAMDRSQSQFAYSEWGAVVKSYTTCQILTDTGLVFFNLTQAYDYVPDTVSFTNINKFLGSGFLSRNQTTAASLWWGESLMSMYWGMVVWDVEKERWNKTNHGEPFIRRGTVSFTRNESYSDIKDLRFFNINYRFMVDLGGGDYGMLCCPDLKDPMTAGSLNAEDIYPNIWIKTDTLVKSAYSTVLTDLGQMSPSTPNILSDESLLEYFTANFTDDRKANVKTGPATESYTSLRDSTGPLGTTPSVIATTYICQVPQLKSAANMIVAIVVADLVLLQAVWQLYKLVAEAILTRRQPLANYCQGCLGVQNA